MSNTRENTSTGILPKSDLAQHGGSGASRVAPAAAAAAAAAPAGRMRLEIALLAGPAVDRLPRPS